VLAKNTPCAAFFLNDGNAPIQLLDMRVSTTVNGRRSAAPCRPRPRKWDQKQRALLLSQSDVWREDFASWSMEIVLRSVRGDVYRNEVSWK